MARKRKREYVTFKSVRLPYYPYEDRGKAYWRFAYPDESVKGGWRYGTRSTKQAAKEAAHTKAVEIANGVLDLSNLAPDQARIARAFLDLNPTWETISIIKESMNEGINLGSAIEQFTAYKLSETGKNTVHLKSVSSQLHKLSQHFGSESPIESIKAPDISKWLTSLGVSPKRTNAYRSSAVALWGWLAKQDMIKVKGTHTEAAKTSTLKIKQAPVELFTPGEMKKILLKCPDEYLPWLVICAYSGVRSGEIAGLDKPPLDWSNFLYESNIIEIPANISKNRKRKLIPILPTLKAWLEHLGNPSSGRIMTLRKINLAPASLGKFIGGWKKNGLRHSYGSYRIASTKDIASTSHEMDNSPAIIKRHYLEAVTEKEAIKYFNLTPSEVFRRQEKTP